MTHAQLEGLAAQGPQTEGAVGGDPHAAPVLRGIMAPHDPHAGLGHVRPGGRDDLADEIHAAGEVDGDLLLAAPGRDLDGLARVAAARLHEAVATFRESVVRVDAVARLGRSDAGHDAAGGRAPGVALRVELLEPQGVGAVRGCVHARDDASRGGEIDVVDRAARAGIDPDAGRKPARGDHLQVEALTLGRWTQRDLQLPRRRVLEDVLAGHAHAARGQGVGRGQHALPIEADAQHEREAREKLERVLLFAAREVDAPEQWAAPRRVTHAQVHAGLVGGDALEGRDSVVVGGGGGTATDSIERVQPQRDTADRASAGVDDADANGSRCAELDRVAHLRAKRRLEARAQAARREQGTGDRCRRQALDHGVGAVDASPHVAEVGRHAAGHLDAQRRPVLGRRDVPRVHGEGDLARLAHAHGDLADAGTRDLAARLPPDGADVARRFGVHVDRLVASETTDRGAPAAIGLHGHERRQVAGAGRPRQGALVADLEDGIGNGFPGDRVFDDDIEQPLAAELDLRELAVLLREPSTDEAAAAPGLRRVDLVQALGEPLEDDGAVFLHAPHAEGGELSAVASSDGDLCEACRAAVHRDAGAQLVRRLEDDGFGGLRPGLGEPHALRPGAVPLAPREQRAAHGATVPTALRGQLERAVAIGRRARDDLSTGTQLDGRIGHRAPPRVHHAAGDVDRTRRVALGSIAVGLRADLADADHGVLGAGGRALEIDGVVERLVDVAVAVEAVALRIVPTVEQLPDAPREQDDEEEDEGLLHGAAITPC